MVSSMHDMTLVEYWGRRALADVLTALVLLHARDKLQSLSLAFVSTIGCAHTHTRSIGFERGMHMQQNARELLYLSAATLYPPGVITTSRF